jgi:hypothetical protein
MTCTPEGKSTACRLSIAVLTLGIALAASILAAEATNLHHPGTITYVDGATQKVIRVEDASKLPDSLRFANTPEGPVPVVKVVLQRLGDHAEILEYGPRGQLLRTTVGTVR